MEFLIHRDPSSKLLTHTSREGTGPDKKIRPVFRIIEKGHVQASRLWRRRRCANLDWNDSMRAQNVQKNILIQEVVPRKTMKQKRHKCKWLMILGMSMAYQIQRMNTNDRRGDVFCYRVGLDPDHDQFALVGLHWQGYKIHLEADYIHLGEHI